MTVALFTTIAVVLVVTDSDPDTGQRHHCGSNATHNGFEDVIVGHGDGDCEDGGAGEEARVQGGGGDAMDGDGHRLRRRRGEVELEEVVRGGEVGLDDEHGGDERVGRVGGGDSTEEEELVMGVAEKEDDEAIMVDSDRVRRESHVAVGIRCRGSWEKEKIKNKRGEGGWCPSPSCRCLILFPPALKCGFPLLHRVAAFYSFHPLVVAILVVWSNPATSHYLLKLHFPSSPAKAVPISIHRTANTSLNSHFFPCAAILTATVAMVDDDIFKSTVDGIGATVVAMASVKVGVGDDEDNDNGGEEDDGHGEERSWRCWLWGERKKKREEKEK